MADPRTGRWFQFGILDLLLLTTIVAIALVASQGVDPKANKARPCIVGMWGDGGWTLSLLPDRSYVTFAVFLGQSDSIRGPRGPTYKTGKWSASPQVEDAFFLEWEELGGLLVRRDGENDTLQTLNAQGRVMQTLKLTWRLEGPECGGIPHGTWTAHSVDQPRPSSILLEYRNGELIDLHGSNGARNLQALNAYRSARGLPALTEHDFPSEDTMEEKPPD